MPFERIDHTADVGFDARGATLDEAIAAAVDGFVDIVHQDADIAPDGTDAVAATAENLEALLFDFLDRLIYLQDADARLVCGAEEVTVTAPLDGTDTDVEGGWTVEARLATAPLERGMGLLDVKGPTYNEMLVEETDEGWRIRAVLDI